MRKAKELMMNTKTNAEFNVLIIDDEEEIREGSHRILTRAGYPAYTAANGQEGLDILSREAMSIVLLDLKMPGIDGMDVLKLLQESYPHILVIIITGFATVETAIEAMKKGAYDFIPKPFEPDQLRLVVNRARDTISLTRETEALELERQRNLKDLDTEKSRLHTIVDSLPNGVVVTNSLGEAVLLNQAFINHLGLPPETESGGHITEYVADEGLCDLILDISKGRHIDFEDIPTYTFDVGEDRHLMARGRPVLGDKKQCLGAVVNLVDITAMKKLDELKSEFVAKVSHELRSPLSTIHEQLAVALGDMVGQLPQSDEQLLSRAKEKTQGLISLIGDLLDLSRIESGSTGQAIREVHLDKLLKNICDFLETKAGSKNQALELDIEEGGYPPLEADPTALESIFGNLITNAIQYTQDGGEIRVSMDISGVNYRVRVMDNGFGIEERHLDKIFEQFFREKNAKTRYITGTGLGLPIVKNLVESLGGLIQVESAPDQGSTFTVLLPLQSTTD